MNCPNCGTYNPEDRTVCWRCDKELPKPKPVKKKNPQQNAQMWLYIIVGIFLVLTLMQTCGFKLPFGPQSTTPAPEGRSELGSPAALVLPGWAESAGDVLLVMAS